MRTAAARVDVFLVNAPTAAGLADGLQFGAGFRRRVALVDQFDRQFEACEFAGECLRLAAHVTVAALEAERQADDEPVGPPFADEPADPLEIRAGLAIRHGAQAGRPNP